MTGEVKVEVAGSKFRNSAGLVTSRDGGLRCPQGYKIDGYTLQQDSRIEEEAENVQG